MKKFLLSVIFLMAFSLLYAQVYLMSNDSIIYTCSGTFYDSGGNSGNYNNSESLTRTFCSSTPGTQITFNFSMFNSEQCCDHLYIYDGASTTGILLVQAEGTNPGTLVGQSITSSTGCLTFRWTSDGSVVNTGWIASIICAPPCQLFQLNVSSDVPFQNNTILLCNDQLIHFSANGNYINNNVSYHQSDSTSVCQWYINNILKHTGYTYDVQYSGEPLLLNVVLQDTFSCIANSSFILTSPNFLSLIHAPSNLSTFWIGQNINLIADSICELYSDGNVTNNIPMYIPDGQGVPYEKVISVLNSNPETTIQSATDLRSVCLNIEHSYVGDLTIHLVCPNGQFLDILTYPDGLGSTWFGIPIDNDANTSSGVGWDYCWSSLATNPLPNMSSQSIPSGDYLPTGTFNTLIGCPVNGDWIIHIEDHLGSDNGFLFNVELAFDTGIVHLNAFDTVSNCSWIGPNIISSSNIVATALAADYGQYVYLFSATNSCGDTVTQYVTVNVIDTPAFVSGRLYIDANLDCNYNTGEPLQHNRVIEFTPGGYFASTDLNGYYMAAIPQGTYTVFPAPSVYFLNVCPALHSYTVQATRGDTLFNIDFADTLKPYTDLDVQLGASFAVIGNDYNVNIALSNYGDTPGNGVLHLQTNSIFTYVSCNGQGSCVSAGPGKVDFSFPAIQPGGLINLHAVFNVPVVIDSIGQLFTTKAWLDTIPDDVNLLNNRDSVVDFIRSSYDPNLKTVMPVGEGQYGYILATDSVLKYTIHFQNTGNWPATNIVIKDTLSAFVDPATIEPGPSSHPYTFNLSGQGIAEFRFMNIMLPDSSSNQSESNGYVCYRIKQRNNSVGTQILNTGNIYFDYNPLVATNTALNIIMAPLQVSAISENIKQKNVYPNPVNNSLFVDHLNAEKITVIEISSVTGNLIASYNFNNVTIAEIPMKKLCSGVYIIRIITENSTEVRRVVKL